jgi:cobalt/nickel transport system ATP-binding protein
MKTQPREVLFSVEDVTYAYTGQTPALEHVDLSINRGEKVAILGSNGSGKSTLLRLLEGLYFPQSGVVKAFDQVLTEEALKNDQFNFSFRSHVGFVFQDSDAQLFMPTVWDEIAFSPLQLGVEPQVVKQRVEAALDALHIQKLRDRAPHQLSGGEKKRVALASVLSLQPSVWLLDEPSAGLDPRSVAWLVSFMNGIGAEGSTVVLATHDLDLASSLADRVYVLDEDHHVAAEGTPAAILNDRDLLKQTNLIG